MYIRSTVNLLLSRFQEPRRFIQILFGPRQTGKTTLAHQLIDTLGLPTHYETADAQDDPGFPWLEHHWNVARGLAFSADPSKGAVLILDEVQKTAAWSELIKRLWDEDTRNELPLKILLLGSSPLLLRKGLTESLAGRFEMIRFMHWSYEEMKDAFGWDLNKYIYFGGYPGAANLIQDEQRWRRYLIDAIIEPSVSRDVIDLAEIRKPALLRRLFAIGCGMSSRIISYNKILGQLQDAGNTTTLAHYLELLGQIGLITGLDCYAPKMLHRRTIPKLQVFNTALTSAFLDLDFAQSRRDAADWGWLVESTVGAHLLNETTGTDMKLHYWRRSGREVDFILRRGSRTIAIEVKAGHKQRGHSGLKAFAGLYEPYKSLLVGGREYRSTGFYARRRGICLIDLNERRAAMRIRVVFAALVAILAAGCTDEITVNTETYCASGAGYPGGITGLLDPPDSGTVNASGSRGAFEAQIGSDGYFILEDLPAGVYALVVSPSDHSRRKFPDVMVDPGETTNMHEITVSTMPYPIYKTRPADGEETFSSSRLTLYVDEALDLDDLADGTTIDPPAEGSWDSDQGICRFTFSDDLRIGITYQVTIDAAAKTEAGEPLGTDLQVSFTTHPLSVLVSVPRSSPGGKVPLDDFYLRLSFNEYVDYEALLTAISFEPEIQGIWLPLDEYVSPDDPTHYARFTFLAYGEPLSPQSTYLLTISDEVELLDGVRLPAPSQTVLDTESHGVVRVSPRNGSPGVPPDYPVRLAFSAAMDTASVESAFSLTEIEGEAVAGVFQWYPLNEEAFFRASEDLHSGSVYRIVITSEGRTASGYNIEPFESYFSVE